MLPNSNIHILVSYHSMLTKDTKKLSILTLFDFSVWNYFISTLILDSHYGCSAGVGAVGIVGVTTIAGALLAPVVLPLIGFTSAGIAAGSIAAAIQGPAILAGSSFAIAQSIGATGAVACALAGAQAGAVIGVTGVAVGAAVGGAGAAGGGTGADTETTGADPETTAADTKTTAADTETTAADTETTAADTESTAADTESTGADI